MAGVTVKPVRGIWMGLAGGSFVHFSLLIFCVQFVSSVETIVSLNKTSSAGISTVHSLRPQFLQTRRRFVHRGFSGKTLVSSTSVFV
jgi:hypothetical protein